MAGEYLIAVRTKRYARLFGVVRRISRFVQPWVGYEARSGVGMPYVEFARGDGVAIGPGTGVSWRRVVIGDDTPWVRHYSGLWGDDTNDPFGGERGPAGPRYGRDATVRQSWGDPVGWAALDAVVPNEAERRAVIVARVTELTDELALSALAARSTVGHDEHDRLTRALDEVAAKAHPHAHLRRRAAPLPTESRERRPLLRLWATLSTPLVFVLLAVMFLPLGKSVVVMEMVGLLAVLALEALTRRRLLKFTLRILSVFVVLSLAGVVVAGLAASWRATVVVLLLAIAAAFLVLNLRELRRT